MMLVMCTMLATLAAGMGPADPGESMTLGAKPPSLDERTVVLFDGSGWDQWRQRDGEPSRWSLQDDGSILVHQGDALTAREFRDFQLHVEFRCPHMPDKTGQARGNSGVYLHGRYEVQVLDSFGLEPAADGCGAIYSVAPPLVAASRPPATWQTYDIVFRAPRFDEAGEVTELPRITVLHNGVVVHNNVEVPRPTRAGMEGMPRTGPILLQDHGDPVRYRNIWVRELDG